MLVPAVTPHGPRAPARCVLCSCVIGTWGAREGQTGPAWGNEDRQAAIASLLLLLRPSWVSVDPWLWAAEGRPTGKGSGTAVPGAPEQLRALERWGPWSPGKAEEEEKFSLQTPSSLFPPTLALTGQLTRVHETQNRADRGLPTCHVRPGTGQEQGARGSSLGGGTAFRGGCWPQSQMGLRS